MKTGVLYEWPTAEQAGRAGFFVRRRFWTTKWLRWSAGLWFLRETGQPERVVRAADFGRDEFLASDWTHMPPECITEAEKQAGKACPLPFAPGMEPPPLDGFGGGPGGDPPPPDVVIDPEQPPRGDLVWPELSLAALAVEGPDCIAPNGGSILVSGSIALSDPANVVPGMYLARIINGASAHYYMLDPGDTRELMPEFFAAKPGASVTIKARIVWGPANMPDITTTGGVTAPDECETSRGEPIGDP